MSQMGHKQTSRTPWARSALLPKSGPRNIKRRTQARAAVCTPWMRMCQIRSQNPIR